MHTNLFCINKANVLSIYSVVSLKIRSRSPNLITFFLYPDDVCASLVKFQALVNEKVCKQTFTTLRKKITKGNNSKRIGP